MIRAQTAHYAENIYRAEKYAEIYAKTNKPIPNTK